LNALTGQTLEWLTLVGEAVARERTMNLLENSYAARSAQADKGDFRNFAESLKEKI
jgi:hypothetical protein